MARGLDSFAAGLLTGYTQGKKTQRDQELHDLQVAKLKDERAMTEEFKALDKDVSPSEGFVITTPDGTRTVFTDEASAKEAQAAMPDAQLAKRFLVAGQQFDSQDQAADAADAANAPAARLRKRAEIAQKYGRPDMASSFMQSYKAEVEANRQIAFEQFNHMRTNGDVEGVLKMINSRPGSNAQVGIVRTEDGGVALQSTVNGQSYVGQSFKSMAELLDGVGAQISATPDNYFERNIAQKRMGLDVEKFAHSKEVDAAQIANAQAQTGIAAGNLGLRTKEFQHAKDVYNNPQPKIISGVDGQGDMMTNTVRTVPQQGGGWGLEVGTAAPTGMRPATTRQGSALDAFLAGGGQPQQPLIVDWGKVPPKNLGAQPAQPVVTDQHGNWTSGNRAGGLITR